MQTTVTSNHKQYALILLFYYKTQYSISMYDVGN